MSVDLTTPGKVMGKSRGVTAQSGFTLIEILLVIAILMGVGVLEMRRDVAKANSVTAVAVGRQIEVVGAAVEQYMAANTSKLQQMADPNCLVTGNYCDLSFGALQSLGYLPQTFNNYVQFGGAYTVRVLRVAPPALSAGMQATICPNSNPAPIGCPVPYPSGSVPIWQYGLQGMVFTAQPWKEGGVINWSMLGAAAREAGPLAGVTSSGTANGLYAGWAAGPAFGGGLSEGQLAFMTGSQVNLWGQFVRRDGSLPMTGNLDMGSFTINNMQDMFINGPISNPRNKNLSSMLPNWVFKGVYAAKDGDDVSAPICDRGGLPVIKLLMQVMKGSNSEYYNNAGISDPPGGYTADQVQAYASKQLSTNAAKHAMINYADAHGAPPTGWTVHFQDIFNENLTGGRIIVGGEGLAELYCNYPDQ